MEITAHAPGTFCWIELGTTHPDEAKSFYSKLFGWRTNDIPLPEGMDGMYTMLQINKKDVAALHKLQPSDIEQGVPPRWFLYVAADDVDATTGTVMALGGTVVAGPFDIDPAGRMAVIQDPSGAMLGLWQAKAHIGTKLVDEPGTIGWCELATRDTETAGAFYAKLFDWAVETGNVTGVEYTMFSKNEKPAGGMMAIDENWGEVPPHWMIYFRVDNCDETVEKVKALDGQVLVDPMDIPGTGRFAMAMDPQGAKFAFIQYQEDA